LPDLTSVLSLAWACHRADAATADALGLRVIAGRDAMRLSGTSRRDAGMGMPGSPTVRRRRLAAELRAIREAGGKSADRVAAALKWSPSKISRYELARTGLRPREVERLLDYYGITGSHQPF